jgi:4-amino-4-deoxy-L-arabinose transferase-like glycosyltransferase
MPADAGLRLGRYVTRHYRLCAFIVLAVMAGNVLLGLATSAINDFEEARYGVSAFEMQQHRSFVVPTYAGQAEYWALKPPLGYWLMAVSFSLFGGSALALRLPSALCSLATVALTMFYARRWFSPRLAILSGLIVATTFGLLSHHGARSGDFDAPLTLILLLVAASLPRLGSSPWWVLALAALLACGFLLKSFAIVPMVLVAGAYLLWTGDWRRQRLGPCLLALGLFTVVVGAWAAARWRADGSPDFLLRMVREDVVQRSTSIVDKSTSSPFGYALALFDRFAPWPILMLVAAAVALRSGRRSPLVDLADPRRGRVLKLLALWTAVPLAIISLVRTQHHWYLDPLYPALAILAAGSVLFLLGRVPWRRRGLAVVALVALPLLLCEGRVLARVLVKEPMPADQRFLAALRPSATGGCREIRSTCRLAYAERFILEVIDGFEVVEPAAATRVAASWPAGSAGTCLLVAKGAWRRPEAPPADRLPGKDRLLADGAAFALYRGAGASAAP